MDETSQLKSILKNSFSGIKKDISDLREKQEESLSIGYRVRQDVDKIKDDYVSKDKMNLLKIKVGEINNTLKKLWDLDESIKKLDEKKTDQKEFEQRFESLRDEISKQLTELNSNTNKRLVEYTNEVNKNIEAVNNNSAKVFSRINEQMKTVVTKTQLNSLTSEMSQEFTAMKKEVAELRKIKETITASELEKRTNLINARVDLLAKELLKTNQNLSKSITTEEVKRLMDEVNKEFEELKQSTAEINKLKRYINIVESEALSKKEFSRQVSRINSEIDDTKKDVRTLVSKKDFQSQVSELNSEIENAKKELKEVSENSKSYARYDDVEKSMNRMETALTRRILDLEKEVLALKRFERRSLTEDKKEHSAESLYTEPKVSKKELKKAEKKAEKERKAALKLQKKEEKRADAKQTAEKIRGTEKKKSWHILSAISLILIVLAFASLAGAIVAYFALEPIITNYATVGAIAFFVIGIILRAIVIKKRQ